MFPAICIDAGEKGEIDIKGLVNEKLDNRKAEKHRRRKAMGKSNAKAWLSLAMIFALCLCIGGESIAATLRVGSSGEET